MIFIKGNVPSLKNSKIATKRGLFMSKTCRKYLQKIGIKKYSGAKKTVLEYTNTNRPNLFKMAVGRYFDGVVYPCVIGFHFVRDTKRKFDFHNAVQIIADLLVAHDYIEDDDMAHFIPIPFRKGDGWYSAKKGEGWYSVNKEKPGVYIKIMEGL